mgnify:CR=1 FL=1
MNAYTYDQLTVGQSEQFTVTVTPAMLQRFAADTGDGNPLHADDAFARAQGYDGRVAYGLLTASFLSTLAGVYLPGKWCLIQHVETDFPRPVYPGDTLTVQGTVREKDDVFHTVTLAVRMRDQAGVTVLRGKMRLGVLR